MTVYEDLEETAYSENIEIIEQYIKNENLKGLYCDNTILLNNRLDSNVKNEVLAHELGHHFTLEDNSIFSDKQIYELSADNWGYRKIFPIEKLINYKLNNYDIDEVCELENITQEYFLKVMNYYKNKYGDYVLKYEIYLVRFFPYFQVFTEDELLFDY